MVTTKQYNYNLINNNKFLKNLPALLSVRPVFILQLIFNSGSLCCSTSVHLMVLYPEMPELYFFLISRYFYNLDLKYVNIHS